MSFTAEVKEELSRIDAGLACDMVQLAALVRVCGTLSFVQKRYRISLATETGAVARTLIRLFHGVYDLTTELTVRRSVLHKTRNYLIVVPEQPRLTPALVQMGILNKDKTIAREIDPALLAHEDWRRAYMRGAFMGGGFVSDPKGDAHFELVAQGRSFADSLLSVMHGFYVNARVSERRGSYVIYLKNLHDIRTFLLLVGAVGSARTLEEARMVKSKRNTTNRLVNAELANQKRAAGAASDQTLLIERVDEAIGIDKLPPALRDFCELRLEYPELSLRELGEVSVPPLSKSAISHRVRRLEELLAELSQNQDLERIR